MFKSCLCSFIVASFLDLARSSVSSAYAGESITGLSAASNASSDSFSAETATSSETRYTLGDGSVWKTMLQDIDLSEEPGQIVRSKHLSDEDLKYTMAATQLLSKDIGVNVAARILDFLIGGADQHIDQIRFQNRIARPFYLKDDPKTELRRLETIFGGLVSTISRLSPAYYSRGYLLPAQADDTKSLRWMTLGYDAKERILKPRLDFLYTYDTANAPIFNHETILALTSAISMVENNRREYEIICSVPDETYDTTSGKFFFVLSRRSHNTPNEWYFSNDRGFKQIFSNQASVAELKEHLKTLKDLFDDATNFLGNGSSNETNPMSDYSAEKFFIWFLSGQPTSSKAHSPLITDSTWQYNGHGTFWETFSKAEPKMELEPKSYSVYDQITLFATRGYSYIYIGKYRSTLGAQVDLSFSCHRSVGYGWETVKKHQTLMNIHKEVEQEIKHVAVDFTRPFNEKAAQRLRKQLSELEADAKKRLI